MRKGIAVVVFGQHLEKSDASDFSGLVAQRQRYMAKDHASVGSNPTEPTNFIGEHMEIYIEFGEMTQKIVEWIDSGEYKTVLEALNGESKDEIFKAACFTLPSIILAKCTKSR